MCCLSLEDMYTDANVSLGNPQLPATPLEVLITGLVEIVGNSIALNSTTSIKVPFSEALNPNLPQ